MEVAEGDNAQVAKRQAIQTIMKDSSLTPQERQKKIQKFMTGGGQESERASSAPAPAPAVSPSNDDDGHFSSAPGSSRQALMLVIMRDSSLTSHEKQKKIQEIMSDGGGTSNAASPGDSSREPAVAAGTPEPLTSSRQELMQQVMKDSSLSPRDKQQKIQEILKGGNLSTGALQTQAKSEEAKGTLTLASDPRAAIQDVVSNSSLTQQEKQKRIQKIMTASAAAEVAPMSEQASRPSSVGAVSSTGNDPASKKGGRGSSAISSRVVGARTSNSEPASSRAMSVGATSATGADPATRKGVSRSISIQPAAAEAETASVEPAAHPSIGAVSSPSSIDPASRKGARGSATTTPGASAGNVASDPSARKSSRGSSSATSSRRTNSNASTAGVAAVTVTSDRRQAARMGVTHEGGDETQEISEIRDLETGVIVNAGTPMPMALLHTFDRGDAQNSSQSAPPPSISSNLPEIEALDHTQLWSVAPRVAAPAQAPQPETYAGLGLTGADIVGADTGGLQAYVAGQPEEEVVGATAVVTETEIEEEDKKRQSRLLKIGVAVFCILLIAIIVPIAILVPGDDEFFVVNATGSPTSVPSAAPTSSTFAELLNSLEVLYPDVDTFEEAFSDNNTPQYQAADWAANIKPLGLSGDDPRMISRYSLAAFYFATNGEGWKRCGVSSTNCEEGREWLTAESECNWLAVKCKDSEGGDYSVIDLFFPPIDATGNDIGGTLPFDLALLSNLERIVLSEQALKGSIPETWSRMSTLTTVFLGGNALTGSFPDFLVSQNALLGSIYMTNNKLSGPLPPLFSQSLQDLRFSGNMITGQLPTEIGGLPALRVLYAETNKITGTIPEELYAAPALSVLRLSNNVGLTGTLSESIATLQNLQQLRIPNTGMGGTLPTGLFELINLKVLEMSAAAFSGTLSADFGKFANVTTIQLNNNAFTGTIPSAAFVDLRFLRTLELHQNDLTGSISPELCNRTGVSFFDISSLTTDCAGDSPKVVCECCQQCF